MMEDPTPAPAPSKWKDPEFIRQYQREKWRQRHPLKRHPNLMEDGSKWTDHHPHGRFNTKEEKIQHYMAKYKPKVPQVECPVCKSMYYETQAEKHKLTKKHIMIETFLLSFK